MYDPFTEESLDKLKRKEICRALNHRKYRTPDFSELALYKEIPLFVYGEECSNGFLNHILKDAVCYGDAHTVSERYTMKQAHNFRHPVVFEVPESFLNKAKIRGQLYGVSVEHIHTLDVIKGNWKEYFRTQRAIFVEKPIPESKVISGFSAIRAYIYIGIDKFWEDRKLESKTRITYSSWGNISNIKFFHHVNYNFKADSTLLEDDDDDRWGMGYSM